MFQSNFSLKIFLQESGGGGAKNNYMRNKFRR